jgi:redox-sensitive bicupin YhaK (pirin superfamily)
MDARRRGDPAHDVAILTLRMQSGATWTLPAAKAGVNRTLYFFAGAGLRIDGESIPAKHAVEMRGDAQAKLECGTEDCEMLLLQGRPIGEPVHSRDKGRFARHADGTETSRRGEIQRSHSFSGLI